MYASTCFFFFVGFFLNLYAMYLLTGTIAREYVDVHTI